MAKTIIKVKGQTYTREGEGTYFFRTYKGERLAVLRKIIEEHGYGMDEEGKESEAELLERIESENGDGCDYIWWMEENSKVVWDLERNEPDEEVVEC